MQPENSINNVPTPPPSGGSPDGFIPPTAPAPVSGSELTKKNRRLKFGKPGLIALGVALLIGGSAAAYIKLVVQNKPENIWKSALSNTAKGYDNLLGYVENDEQLKELKGAKASGSFKAEGPVALDGTYEAKSFEMNGSGKLSIGYRGNRVNLEMLTTASSPTATPDIYLKASGIRGIGPILGLRDSGTNQFINSLDNQWIAIDHTLLDQILQAAEQQGAVQPTLSKEEALEIGRAFGEVNRQYLLSDAPDRRVFEVVENVGKEDRDGRETFHFKVKLNKENLEKYAEALKDRLADTKVKSLAGNSYDQWFNQLIEGIKKDTESFGDDDTADVWVDMDTRLIRFVRFTSPDKKDNYVELGLLYDGGDEFPFVIKGNITDDPEPGTVTFTTTLNTKTDSLKLALDVNYKDRSGKTVRVTGDFTVEPNSEAVQVEKPAGAKSIMEILGPLLGGSLQSGPTTSPSLLSNPILGL